MDRFERQVIEERERQARAYEAGARHAERRGCPNHAATLRRRAEYSRRVAEDTRLAAEWRHKSEDERFPL